MFLFAVYIHPRADATTALHELLDIFHKYDDAYSDAVFIAARDFNHSNLKSSLPVALPACKTPY